MIYTRAYIYIMLDNYNKSITKKNIFFKVSNFKINEIPNGLLSIKVNNTEYLGYKEEVRVADWIAHFNDINSVDIFTVINIFHLSLDDDKYHIIYGVYEIS
jgi:hypothetical protein